MESNTILEPTQIFFFLGESQSGKDTAGEMLCTFNDFTRVSFADAVKDEVAELHGIDVRLLHQQGPIKEQYRDAMISLAEGKRAIDPLCWVKRAFKPYQNEDGSFKPGLKLVVTDCRRDAEIDWILAKKTEIANAELAASEAETARHYEQVRLFNIIRHNKPVDKDVLTHACIGYALGIQKMLNEQRSHIRLIDAFVYNNDTLEQLAVKLNALVQTFSITHI